MNGKKRTHMRKLGSFLNTITSYTATFLVTGKKKTRLLPLAPSSGTLFSYNLATPSTYNLGNTSRFIDGESYFVIVNQCQFIAYFADQDRHNSGDFISEGNTRLSAPIT